jgi:hypothetical protein
MFPFGTVLRVTPERLALIRQPDRPRPLPPPSWEILTDARWAELQQQFDLPDTSGDISVRAHLEYSCIGLIELQNDKKRRALCKLDDNAIRWLSKASNVGKSLEVAISPRVIERLSLIAEALNEPAGRTMIRPEEIAEARTLTVSMQLCAVVCWSLARRSRRGKHAVPFIDIYAALWRTWEECLGRRVTLWAHPNGNASTFVKFVTCLLRWSQERMPDDDAVARKNVLARLADAKQRLRDAIPAHGLVAAALVPAPEWRLRLRRRTSKSGFSRSRPRIGESS